MISQKANCLVIILALLLFISTSPYAATIGEVKILPDGSTVQLGDKIVTAIFTDESCIYISEPDRSCGIRVSHSGSGLSVGSRVNVSGIVNTYKPDGTRATERHITSAAITSLASFNPLAPYMMTCRAVGGAPIAPYILGVNDDFGANNMGSLVKIAGRITQKMTSYIYVDDGSNVKDILDGSTYRIGVMVRCLAADTPFNAGNIVAITGVVQGSRPSNWSTNRRLIRIRDGADIKLIATGDSTCAISGVVRDSTGSPITGATVSTTTGGYSTTSVTGGLYAMHNLPPGNYTVVASKTGYSNQIKTASVAAGSAANLNFSISFSVGTITGTVKDTYSVGLVGATVSTTTGGYSTITNSTGAYTISNVAAGTYSVVASCGGWIGSTQTGKTVTTGQTTSVNFSLSRDTGSAAGPVKLGTHFFYWHDAPGNNSDRSKMPYDPPGIISPYNGTYYSSLSTPWYEWQLNDMKLAGVDYCFPVSWGEKYQSTYFKQSVLTRLVQAVRNTNSPIKIGLYDDTSSEPAEWNADNGRGYTNSQTNPALQLSCSDPQAPYYFYNQKIKPFFQMIPRDLWATHNGRPIANGGRPLILTFVSYYYKDVNQAHILWQQIKTRFTNDFGVVPWIAPCWSWWYFNGKMNQVADGEVVYGAANGGIYTYSTPNGYVTSNLGPGCDTRLIGRTDYKPRWSNRQGDPVDDGLDDQWLRDNFQQAPTNCNLVVLESWNELWEGSAISRCVDFPRRTGGYTSETYYMEKTMEQMRALRDRISVPTSLQNGTMETFTSGIANSWIPFWVYGDVTFSLETSIKHGGSRAMKLAATNWAYLAGVYQRVTVTTGSTYTFRTWTYRHDDRNNGGVNEETWVGIDPTGGVDPTSSNIVWSANAYSYHTWTQQSVTATASSNKITVFIRARSNYAGNDMYSVFDDATLQ